MRAAPPVFLPNTVAETIFSEATQTPYRLSISLPRDYTRNGQRYPVIYALDGLWHFALLCQLENDLVYGQKMPAAIVVGLDYEGSLADTMRLRERDLTPWKFGTGRSEAGGADRFLIFLERELIPRIEADYRVDPDNRSLAGHSYGGLFCLYALAKRPGLFNRILAASPSLDRRLLAFIAAQAAVAHPKREIRLDVSCGADELTAQPADAALFKALPAALSADAARNQLRLDTRYAVYAAQTHGSVRSVSYNYGLGWLFGTDRGSNEILEYKATP